MYKLADRITAARRVSAPLIYINSPDPSNSIHSIMDIFRNGDDKCPHPVITWNVNQGARPMTDAAVPVIERMREAMESDDLANPVDMLIGLEHAPAQAVVFMEHLSLFMDNPQVIQGLYDVRDEFKSNHRTLICVGPSMVIPKEVRQSFVILDEPYPSPEELHRIISVIVESVERETDANLNFTDTKYNHSVDALRGLCAYTAEQEFSMSLSKDGIDIDGLWERKRIIIEQTPGLSVYRPKITMDDIGGCKNAKNFLSQLMLGKNSPKVIVWIDEIDKSTAADKTDTSGVSQDRLGFILQYMQENESKGVVFLGPPGTSKSMMAKALGALTGILTIRLDLGEMLGGIVGESQHNLREAFKVISAVADRDVLFIATCNNDDTMDSALQRRFKRGKIFFDLPEDDEKEVIWNLHMEKQGISENDPKPDHASWTGAEIASCCEMAYDMDLTLRQASEYIVPVAVTAHKEIEALRSAANGRFISAAKPGFFYYSVQKKPKRAVKVED